MDSSLHAKMRLSSSLLPLLVGITLLLQLIAPYRGWLILFAGLGGAWFVSFLWARSLTHGMEFQREIRYGWAQVGDQLEERFTLINHGIFPALWVEVIDQSTLPDYEASQVRSVDGNSATRWRIKRLCRRRGLFSLGPTTLLTGDPFGIYTVELSHLGFTNVLITPPIVPLPFVEVASGGRSGEGRPRRAAPLAGVQST